MSKRKKVIIIGAGPAGLTAGYELIKKGFDVLIIEQDLMVGGIARTINYKNFRFDIGGHRFFTKNDEIQEWRYSILKDNFLVRKRLSRWYYRGKFFNYPIILFELVKIFGVFESFMILASFLKAKIFPIKPERTLEDWCINNFGYRLARPFFIDYNEKLWGVRPNKLSKDFASQRIKGLSFISTLKESAKKLLGIKKTNVKSFIEQFYYPKLGPGMLWEEVENYIKSNGGVVLKGYKVIKVNHKNGKITSVVTRFDKSNKEFKADYVLSSMPLKELILSLSPEPPREIIECAKFLSFRDFITVALMINQNETIPDTWVYTHDKEVKCIRIQIFKNWSPFMVPEGKSCIGFEYTCKEGDEFWNKSDKELIEVAKLDLSKLGFAKLENVFDAKVIRMRNVYPVYELGYDHKVEKIKKYLTENFVKYNLQPIGRGGLHRYNNMDHSMMTAFLAVKNILGEGNFDQWKVNSDAEYHEEKNN
ncbi:MAG: NAD(P)/FAD-dependent oxidoreductase [Candidatus Pacearchaeota archaeon]